MAAISTRFGSGGSNLTPNGSSGAPSLAGALRDVADDIAGMKGIAVVGGALPAFTDPPSAAEMAALRALVNELRLTQVNRAAYTVLTTKV